MANKRQNIHEIISAFFFLLLTIYTFETETLKSHRLLSEMMNPVINERIFHYEHWARGFKCLYTKLLRWIQGEFEPIIWCQQTMGGGALTVLKIIWTTFILQAIKLSVDILNKKKTFVLYTK